MPAIRIVCLWARAWRGIVRRGLVREVLRAVAVVGLVVVEVREAVVGLVGEGAVLEVVDVVVVVLEFLVTKRFKDGCEYMRMERDMIPDFL